MWGFFKNPNSTPSTEKKETIPGIDRTYMANIVGPGYWSAIHKISADAKDEQSKAFFVNYMDYIRNNFPCSECKSHINEYMSQHPIQPYLSKEDGCFRWAWEFHNTVNRRLKKREVPWEEATKIYKKDHGVCSLNCASGKEVHHKNQKFDDEFIGDIMNSKHLDEKLGYVVRHNFRHSK